MRAEVVGAVVATVTDTVWLAPFVICTEELDKAHVGAGEPACVMLQLRLTVPLNDPEDAMERVKFAPCPALIVCDVGDPEAGPRLKLAPVATPEREIVCGLPVALSEMVIVPVRFPLVDGLNVTEIWQLLPAATDVLQVLVSSKF